MGNIPSLNDKLQAALSRDALVKPAKRDLAAFKQETPVGVIGASVPTSILSLMADAYGHHTREMGYETEGHLVIGPEDLEIARTNECSLLYGEVLPEGVMKMLDRAYLRANSGTCLFDLGCGTGKLCVQAFLCYRNVLEVFGVEISPSRYRVAEAALNRLLQSHSKRFRIHSYTPDIEIAICEDADDATYTCGTACLSTGSRKCRVLRIRRADLFDVSAGDLRRADMLVMETDLPEVKYPHLCSMLAGLSPSTRLLTYLNLHAIWPEQSHPRFVKCPMRQVPHNLSSLDRFATSWAFHSGHHFYLWQVMPPDNHSVFIPAQPPKHAFTALLDTSITSIPPARRQWRMSCLLGSELLEDEESSSEDPKPFSAAPAAKTRLYPSPPGEVI